MAEALRDVSRPARAEPPGCGLPPEQVQAWMETVADDLARVRVRLEYLQLEEQRLVEQQRLLGELLASSS
jgi:hypothetical protein